MICKVLISFLSSSILLGGCAGSGSLPPTPVQEANLRICDIHMFDARHGWVEASGPAGPEVLRTTNGGRSWMNVTPESFPRGWFGCEFATESTAWISIHTNAWAGLLMTRDGGNSWRQVIAPFGYFTEASAVHFYNDRFGVADSADGGLGSSYDTFYETQNGGRTWEALDVTPRYPEPGPGVTPRTFHLSNICGDRLSYYPPGTFVIANGESGDEKPLGSVQLSVSANSGKSWRDLQLPLPAEYRGDWAAPQSPVFFSQRDGILPVEVFTQDAHSRTFLALLFYRTSDGGKTWTARQPVMVSPFGLVYCDCDIVSLNNIVVRDRGIFHVTHDGAKSWRTVTPNIDLGAEGSKRDLARLDFVDPLHGWLIISDLTFSRDGNVILYQTSDGGKTWAELPLKIQR